LLRRELENLEGEFNIPIGEEDAVEVVGHVEGGIQEEAVNRKENPEGAPPDGGGDSSSDSGSSAGEENSDEDEDDSDDESSSDDGTIKGAKALSKVLCRLVKDPKKTRAKGKRDIAKRMKKYNLLGLDPGTLPNKILRKTLKNPKKLLSTNIFKFLPEHAKIGKED
ncbi:hypothetical protein FOL47_005723, partial [Perkinsus chesapeaki]